MKGLVFVVAVALACCVTTCEALSCIRCSRVNSREACLNETWPREVCNQTQPRCFTGTWTRYRANKVLCDPTSLVSVCVGCCDTDLCFGQPGAATDYKPDFGQNGAAFTVRISVVTMATAVMAVLLKNAAGF